MRVTFEYDANGKNICELEEYWSNGQWVASHRFTCTRDAEGNMTSWWYHAWDGSSWTPENFRSRSGIAVTDDAGNNYYFNRCYNITFTFRAIISGVSSLNRNVPSVFSLSQNYPNPFNPSTNIKFELPRASQVNLSVFDILGCEVSVLVNDRRDAGVHDVRFDGSTLASAVYFYRLQAGDFVQSKKFLLLK